MGNRAVITTEENWKHDGVGIYLHWNGGRDSVEGFLKYCELKGYRSHDSSYGLARLCQVIGNFFGGTLCVGIDTLWHLDCDNGDNGVYIIKDWKIVNRVYFNGVEQQEYSLKEMLSAIDGRMPENERFGDEFIENDPVPVGELEVGDKVYVVDDGKAEIQEIVGIGKDCFVNGTNVHGIPYINLYGYDGKYDHNINNYLLEPAYVRHVEKPLDNVL